MRIGMILDKTFPPDPRVENEAHSLIGAGHQVFLFCVKYKDEPVNASYNGIELRRFSSSKFTYKLSALAYSLPFYTQIMAPKIAQFLKKNAIEVIHIHDMRIAAAVYKANGSFKLPIVLDLHENLPEIMKYYEHVNRFPGNLLIDLKKWKRKEETFIKNASKVIVVTQESIDEIKGRVAIDVSKLIALPNTVRKSFYQKATIDRAILDKFKDHFVLLYIGDTALRRGLTTAISAIDQLKQKIQNIKLVIVGKGSSDLILRKLVTQLQLEDQVEFEGWQDPALFQSYIMASSICISPLHRNKHHDTTYANKIFQYMSLSKPVLVSDAIAQKNLIEATTCGLVHEQQNADDFAEKVYTLYRDKSYRLKLGTHAKQAIQTTYNWELSSKKLQELYEQLAK